MFFQINAVNFILLFPFDLSKVRSMKLVGNLKLMKEFNLDVLNETDLTLIFF